MIELLLKISCVILELGCSKDIVSMFPELSLEIRDLLLISNTTCCKIALLLFDDVKLFEKAVVLSFGIGNSQLLIERLKLVTGVSFPLLEFVDSLDTSYLHVRHIFLGLSVVTTK